jgi:hypothetical protein
LAAAAEVRSEPVCRKRHSTASHRRSGGTTAGNILIQAISLGQVESLETLREIVRDSFPLQTFGPLDAESWLEAYDRFTQLNLTT